MTPGQQLEFMEKEHEAGKHLSTDWANLKGKCYECYKLWKHKNRIEDFNIMKHRLGHDI